MGSFSIWHLLIFLLIAVVIFGTTRLTRGAKDLGIGRASCRERV